VALREAYEGDPHIEEISTADLLGARFKTLSSSP
jgi:hypothetical protein